MGLECHRWVCGCRITLCLVLSHDRHFPFDLPYLCSWTLRSQNVQLHNFSILSRPRLLALTHSSSITNDSQWELSKTACVIKRSSPCSPLALFTPTLLFPSPIHPSPRKGWGMHGCIPGLMKLILQECSPMWLLERHRQKTKGCLFKWGATKDHWGVSMCWGEDKKKRNGTRGGKEVLKWIAPLNHRAGWETVTFPD